MRLSLATTSELRFDAATAPNRFRFSGPPTKLEGVIGTLGSRPPLADVVCSLNRTQNILVGVLCGIFMYQAIVFDRKMRTAVVLRPWFVSRRACESSFPVTHGQSRAFARERQVRWVFRHARHHRVRATRREQACLAARRCGVYHRPRSVAGIRNGSLRLPMENRW